jgi:protein TonB
MRFRLLTAASVAFVVLSTSTWRVQAQQSSPAPGATPLTMGQLALLLAKPEKPVDSLRTALQSSDPGVRAIAARIVDVGRIVALEPDLVSALTGEQDDRVAADMLRAALRLNTPNSRAAVASYLPRSGPATLQAYAEHLARIAPDRLIDELPTLMTRLADIDNHLHDIVLIAGEQHRNARERLMRTWLAHASGPIWGRLLSRLPSPPDDPAENRILVDALASADGAIRQETAWRVVSWLAESQTVDASVLDAAAASADGAEDWEALARELVRRKRGAEPVDRSAVLQQLGPDHSGDVSATARLPQWSAAEQRIVRTIVGNTDSSKSKDSSPTPVAMMATVRAADAPWPGFFTSLFDAAGCKKTSTPTYGGIVISYSSDGRPMSVGLDHGSLSPACQNALAAVAGIVEIEGTAAVPSDTRQWLIMTTQRDVVACADEPEPPESTITYPVHVRIEKNPKRKKSVQPNYPGTAQRAGLEGTVTIASLLSTTGCVRHARVVRSVDVSLDVSAIMAVTQWHYEPAIVQGTPRMVEDTIYIRFALR